MRKYTITDAKGNPYLTRHVIQENKDGSKIYLHEIHQSDDDRDHHDHPWDFESHIVKGCYIDHALNGVSVLYRPGMVNKKLATDAHRVEIVSGPVITIVYRGPKLRKWGFWTKGGWQPHESYLDAKFGVGNWNTEYE